MSKKMRFSDVFSMNDFMEMHWGYHIWELAASEVIDKVGKDFLDKIDDVIHSSGVLGLVTDNRAVPSPCRQPLGPAVQE